MTPDEILRSLQTDALGLEREDEVRTLDGGSARRRRVYLDTTATALMPGLVWRGLESYLRRASANSHTAAHRAGRATTAAIEESRTAMARLVGAEGGARDRDFVVLFTGNGATGALNFLARALFPPELRLPVKRGHRAPPDQVEALRGALARVFPEGAEGLARMRARPLVVATLMEHHSNILPWVEAVGRDHLRFVRVLEGGCLDLAHLREILEREGHLVRLVTVSGASNVTGQCNPIHEIAALAHRVGAQIVVDGAQLAPHRRIDMGVGEEAIDFLVISGHKLYAPGSRGVLVGRLALLDRKCIGDVGGGMVEYVSVEDFRVKAEVTAREEAGTPNIPGTIALGIIAEALHQVGMDRIAAEESELCGYALDKLASVPGVTLYGSRDPAQRVGVFALNVAGLHHGLTAAFLDDHYNIATRNECFCAHPYVKALLGIGTDEEHRYLAEMECGDRRHIPGMVRLSLGIYSTRADVDLAAEALAELGRRKESIQALYEGTFDGAWHLRAAAPGSADPLFLPSSFLYSAAPERSR